ncbi:VOC family protein [Acidobacteria bacterium AH-259-D05]|nr:VOC family protein [Acidobacteria bacterium AH-259-D05]
MFRFHHVSLSVTNINKSVEFYSIFGFRKVHEWCADDGSLQIIHLRLGDSLLELFCFSNPKEPPESTRELETDLPVIGVRHFALQVNSIIDARNRVIEKGYKPCVATKRGRTGIDYFFVKDPDGIFVEIVQDDRKLE